ncbi:hypothetical protein B0H14DRAFT_2826276 [Mycena olivaceomarginata]|nr:hypothetical protein B0H14DRAFT_2826276 [Mycena olivaceomarginata]
MCFAFAATAVGLVVVAFIHKHRGQIDRVVELGIRRTEYTVRTYIVCAGTFRHDDTEGGSEGTLSVGLEFCTLGGECAAALKVAHGQLCPALLTDPKRFKLLGFALGFLNAEGLNLLFTDDARALFRGDLAAKRVEVEGGSLGVLGSRSAGVVGVRLVLQALDLLEPLAELILLLL